MFVGPVSCFPGFLAGRPTIWEWRPARLGDKSRMEVSFFLCVRSNDGLDSVLFDREGELSGQSRRREAEEGEQMDMELLLKAALNTVKIMQVGQRMTPPWAGHACGSMAIMP